MNQIFKITIIGAAIAATGLLSLRGATAFYKQYTSNPGQAQSQGDAQGPQGEPKTEQTKAQRLARASQIVAGMGKQGQVTDVFSAPDGTTGVIIKSGEGQFIGWMVPGIEAVWVGAKFDAKGRNLTQEEMIARGYAQPLETPPQAVAARNANEISNSTVEKPGAGLLRAVNQSPGFVEGASGPLWTAYIDGNCIYCTQLWRNLRGPISSGQIRVRWAPVAVIAPSSAGQAATLLQTDRPLEILTQHATTGAPIPASQVQTRTQNKIDTNNAMLRALNANKAPATPTLVVPGGQDAPIVITGIPPDVDALIKASQEASH